MPLIFSGKQQTGQHALIFPPAYNWRTTQLHYLFTDGCGDVDHCQACHARYAKDVFPNIHRTQGRQGPHP